MNPDAEATDAAPAAPASESATGISPGPIASSGNPAEQAARRPTARRKPVPPVHGGGATPVQPPRQKPLVDAENTSRERGAVAERPEAPTTPAQRPASTKAARRVTRPAISPTPIVRPQVVGAAPAAATPSAVREPQRAAAAPAAEARVAAQPTAAQPPAAESAASPQVPIEEVAVDNVAVQSAPGEPASGQQTTAAAGATAVTAAPEAPTSTQAPIAGPETVAPAAPVAGPPREPKLKKRKGPAPGAVRPIDTPRQRVEIVLAVNDLVKRFGSTTAVAGITLQVRAGSFFGLVGPNGAGKTTTLSMVTGLLRPDSGSVIVHGADVWSNPVVAKRNMGVLPDSLRLFDRLTGAQLLYYAGVLRGLDAPTVQSRTLDLAEAFGLTDALDRLVTDYSAGMTKKIALAAAMIHSPRLLVLDEPFESVDPVSAANVTEILQRYVAAGGTVVLSSHSMDLIQRICDDVAIVVNGRILASGPVDRVRGEGTLEERFVELAGGRRAAEGMEWLHSFSD